MERVDSTFEYDVFLSYCSKDKETAQALGKLLRKDGVRVCAEAWGERSLAHVEKSRTLVMCMSPDYFESEWGKLQHHSMLFRDPTNANRRFLPLLIKQCNTPDIIAQFAHIDWRTCADAEYEKLLATCRRVADKPDSAAIEGPAPRMDKAQIVLKGHRSSVWCVAATPDGKTIVSGSYDHTLKVWDIQTGHCRMTLKGHKGGVRGVAIAPDGARIASTSLDRSLKVWDVGASECIATLTALGLSTWDVAVSSDGRTAVSDFAADALGVWDIETMKLKSKLQAHTGQVDGVAISNDMRLAVSGSHDETLKIWELESGQCLKSLEGHTGAVFGVAISSDAETVISGSTDDTLKVWDLKSGQCRATFEGHTDRVNRVVITPDGKRVVSASDDGTVRVWDLATGRCLKTFEGHSAPIYGLALTPDGNTAISGALDHTLRVWDLARWETIVDDPDSTRYTNAKVVLVGESGAGKTGLALRLAEDRWQETESTHGMNVWPLKLDGIEADGMEREVWLWDFAGQPDYRLIHQLYMDETALALLVIDPQADNPFAPLEHWDKALEAAVKNDPSRILVAARCDRGGYTISEKKIAALCEGKYAARVKTAAKSGDGCAELKARIEEHIPWDRLPWTATSQLFKTLKDSIIAIKDEEITLVRTSELRQRLQLELNEEQIQESEIRTVVGLLESQGIVKRLDFGDFVLLQPAEINNYASGVVRCARENVEEIGVVAERDVLDGNIDFKDMKRLEAVDEKILLRAMLQTFVDRSLCALVETEKGTQLVFPSYFKVDRPEAPDVPPTLVTYGFAGPIEEVYSTLVVRLHYTETFEMDQLWRYAADFKTQGGQKVGLHLTKKSEGKAEIEVYFEADVHDDTKVSFIKYIHEHLKKYGQDVTRVRSYVCPHCDEPLENRKAIRRRIEKGLPDIVCSECEGRVPFNDLIENKFASDQFLRTVQAMDVSAQINIDNESRELILVGHAFTIAGEAGQIFRPTPNSDWGIDGEIEFKAVHETRTTKGGEPAIEATGKRVYLQLKSGDSYLYHRKGDDSEVFAIKNDRLADYWLNQPGPVMLVIRTSDGEIRWMNITEYLEEHGVDAKQVVFEGEAFTAANVAQMRNRMLGSS